ncbi:pyrroline-5-carboxylate reductase [Enterococcus phoeniculicola]|jgi:pyrroline-5-carboxylate reductase|uniref:Pyrroline-5-carboxylate reductase n=1 Tax=Enterococcus phoeniculicola ATCC BAA-412 TaxID=1158610 RepID=R3TNP0_9ENTE|nr:pyrroline-5-carboxylate reductase [Enterococcus phoeniculicola]EOL43144.1 pyrroline-5-carboxylate reductase [Enterococcus phoeniculicola ATCC BAA-412]EOT76498.1 pyrroline-5-carboxylate reductase [Enterococcus phoeniculicola ATCC BAA-412]OJG71115.1 pyrroline-5-carboxylate reductase [Enterococcus phoeniculicola]
MNIGIFGAGQMGGAMIEGWLHSGKLQPQEILVKGGRASTAKNLQKQLNFQLTDNLTEFADCDLLFIAVGTPVVIPILKSLKEENFKKRQPIISVAAGISLSEMQEVMGKDYPLAHAIPNTPVQIGKGLTAVTYSSVLSATQKDTIKEALHYLGDTIETVEERLDIISSVAGCGPAFVDIFMEALSDGAVLHGMPRDLSYEVIAKMLIGSASLALESGKHPGALKDGVTSPGGTTIRGVAALEKNGFRHAVISGIDAIISE